MKRLRTAIKRVLIAGYCRQYIPAWIVSSTFWVLRLKHL